MTQKTSSEPDTPRLGGEAGGESSRTVLLVLSVTAGVSVAGLYYIQPLLSLVAGKLGVSVGEAGLLFAGVQVGYVLGLAFIVPLGDLRSPRALLAVLLSVSALTLLCIGFAESFAVLCPLLVVGGLTASSAMVALPLAVQLAPSERRGQATGTVMSGLLLGVLLSQTVSGALTQIWGWHAVFFVAAAVELLLAATIVRVVPKTVGAFTGSYRQLLFSVASLVRRSGFLRGRMLLGFLSMFGFSLLWTSVAFVLSGDGASRYAYSTAVIGLFPLAGAAGVLSAPLVGRWADRGHARRAMALSWGLVVAGWGFAAWGGSSLAALVVGLVVFDLGAEAVQLINQHSIYEAFPHSRSRAVTGYMVSFFFGGVAGSFVSGFAYQAGGWPAVCGAGLAASVVGAAAWGAVARTRPDEAERAEIADMGPSSYPQRLEAGQGSAGT